MSVNESIVNELKRIKRVSDMMVTSHANLNQYYRSLAIISNTLLFACSTILCVVVFSDPNMLKKYFGEYVNLYIGILSILSFIYSAVASWLDWGIKAEKHRIAFQEYAELKLSCNELLKKAQDGENINVEEFLMKYKTLTPRLIAIPEWAFLSCKKKHISKVFISKHLDERPGTSITLLKVKLWFRDNFRAAN